MLKTSNMVNKLKKKTAAYPNVSGGFLQNNNSGGPILPNQKELWEKILRNLIMLRIHGDEPIM